jgi:hypothetical protein
VRCVVTAERSTLFLVLENFLYICQSAASALSKTIDPTCLAERTGREEGRLITVPFSAIDVKFLFRRAGSVAFFLILMVA